MYHELILYCQVPCHLLYINCNQKEEPCMLSFLRITLNYFAYTGVGVYHHYKNMVYNAYAMLDKKILVTW